MCTSPIKTWDKQTGKEITFACRNCNDCIAARQNDWVARGVAEKATSAEAMVLNLTYRDNHDGTSPDGAVAFRYGDVQKLLKRIRKAYCDLYGKDAAGEIRYIVAGERGSLKGRVHWHMVIFADRKFTFLGKWYDFVFKLIPGPLINHAARKRKRMCHWSMWEHGHIVVQEPDQAGISYVLKYALKDQFNVVKARGTAREAKSELSGASFFRMSKKPPIGMRFLERRCDDWERRRVVPVKLELKIPEYKGFWWPKGQMREYLLLRLHQINERCKRETGSDAPQWNTLVASMVEETKDWETLVYGEIEQEEIAWELEEFKESLSRKKSPQERKECRALVRQRCGGAEICVACWAEASNRQRQKYREWLKARYKEAGKETQHDAKITADNRWRAKEKCNPFCGLRYLNSIKDAFEAP